MSARLLRSLLAPTAAALAALALLLPTPAAAVGEQTGRIAGTVTEAQSGAPVPGAVLTLDSPALIGGKRKLETDENGYFLAADLAPGTYDVELTYAGVKPLKRKVVVRQGVTTPLDISWSAELAAEEVTVVKEERHLTKPDSTASGTVITNESAGKRATGRSYQDLALEAAGTVDVNGGGNPQVKGSMYTMNRYLVDGLDITDPVTNTFSSNINFDSIASVEVLTGGMEAEYNSMGGVVNLITAGGSDEWKLDSSVLFNHASLSSGAQYGSALYDGVRPKDSSLVPPHSGYQANINLGGPIVEHSQWFHFSLEYRHRESSTVKGPPLDVQEPPEVSNLFLLRGKYTFQPSAKHRLTLSVSADPATFDNVAQDNSRLAVAENWQGQGGFFAIAQWDYFPTPELSTNLQLGAQYSYIDYGPQGWFSDVFDNGEHPYSDASDKYEKDRPAHTNYDDGTVWYQGDYVYVDRRYTLQADPSVSYRASFFGEHDAKAGVQTRFIRHTMHLEMPGNAQYGDFGGGPGEAGLCDETTGIGCYQKYTMDPYDQHEAGYSVGLFVQDRWKVTRRWTVLPGLRFDKGSSKNAVDETVSDLWGIGPRLGTTFDLTGDGKTIALAFYGRANEVLSLLAASSAGPTSVTNVLEWNPDTGRFEQSYASGGASGYRTNPRGRPPHTDEFLVGLRREFAEDSVATLEFTHKVISNIWERIEQNQIWDPTGTRVVGYKNGTAEAIYLYTRPDENYRIYDGLDLTVESRPNEHWELYGAYTLSFLYGPGSEEMGQIGNGTSQFTNPRDSALYDGYLPEDVRHQLKLHGSHTWDEGLLIGAGLTYSTGNALTKRFFNAYDGAYTSRRSPGGTEPGAPNNSSGFSEFRPPDLMLIDTRVGYDFEKLLDVHLLAFVDVFNVLDVGTPTRLVTSDTASFGEVSARTDPLRVQLGLRLVY